MHLACESLRRGETDLALGGGVFAVMGPTPLIGLSQTDMLAHSGRCRSFDAEADGMAMSEGVGMVVLKRLRDAIADNDPIYGVIKASGINQDGASNGITAPSGSAQQALIIDTYKRFGINPEHISYIEAHGTGTRLGDPVEANALVAAFRQFTDKTGYCAVGSGKANIGHSTASAAVLGLIKVLLSLKHRLLPAMPHFKSLNPLIEFEQSPFYPATRLQPWQNSNGAPLMAALNSFGHSGTNAHLVIAEYTTSSPSSPTVWPAMDKSLIVLSAKNDERLLEVCQRLSRFLEQADSTLTLSAVAYTLQLGREAMTHRLAFVVNSIDALRQCLTQFVQQQRPKQCWYGQVSPKALKQPRLLASRALESLESIAEAWVNGAEIDWLSYYPGAKPKRLHLPSYPFAKERYWKPERLAFQPSLPALLHPLLHSNISTLAQLAYRSRFTGDEFFLSGHVVQGQKVLPGVVYLAMAAEAAKQASPYGSQHAIKLSHIVWLTPWQYGRSADELQLRLEAKQDLVQFEVVNVDNANSTLHCQGGLAVIAKPTLAPLKLEYLQQHLDSQRITPEQCYQAFVQAGVCHSGVMQALSRLYVGDGEVLAELRLSEQDDSYDLHPALLDAALQATLALGLTRPEIQQALMPFTLDQVIIYQACSGPTAWAWLRLSGENRLDIVLSDANGQVCVELTGLVSRAVQRANHDEITRHTGMDCRYPEHKDVKATSYAWLLDSATRDRANLDSQQIGSYHQQWFEQAYYLQEHNNILPVAVLLEHIVTTAQKHSPERALNALRQIVWPRYLQLTSDSAETVVRFASEPEGLRFNLTSASDETLVYCQGVVLSQPDNGGFIDLTAVRQRCPQTLTRMDCDRIMQHSHGERLLTLQALAHGEHEALALLTLASEQVPNELDAMSPSLLNGAIVACVVLTLSQHEQTALPMPMSLDEWVVYDSLPTPAYAHIRLHEASSTRLATLDFDMTDSAGRVIASARGLTLVFQASTAQTVCYARRVGWVTTAWMHGGSDVGWVSDSVTQQKLNLSTPLFISSDNSVLLNALQTAWPDAHCQPISNVINQDLTACLQTLQQLAQQPPALLQPIVVLSPDDNPLTANALSGLLKTANLEQVRVLAKVIVYSPKLPLSRFIGLVQDELSAATADIDISFNELGQRSILGFEAISLPSVAPANLPITPRMACSRATQEQLPITPRMACSRATQEQLPKAQSVVLITGGLGGIGWIIAQDLARSYQAKLVLIGRSPLSPAKQQALSALQVNGAELNYYRVDCSDTAALTALIADIKQRYGRLEGVIHSAGVIADAYLAYKKLSDAEQVWRPKINGVLALEQALADTRLDFFVLFSSIAGCLGNPGQADYAAANAFLDGFARQRAKRVQQGRAFGKTVSINWPLWQDGGMQMTAQHQLLMRDATGMTAMPSHAGLTRFMRH
ncbi:SDR family NAD(P)-dependent oxidoreductase [Methylocucumis oryzae]|uniref:Carrier domain-containing protein n=1 Tax=Methylocucumis oryzae TaxID=1632867 RepID=A0A0F3IJP9_9GAMM|nr:SDR family NAD(P)-dependent oxidoreductase [Methylocucumis oryzae]KJV06897.1 hypothetical protein VZ94_08310 [Methylocucumis oryzae]